MTKNELFSFLSVAQILEGRKKMWTKVLIFDVFSSPNRTFFSMIDSAEARGYSNRSCEGIP